MRGVNIGSSRRRRVIFAEKMDTHCLEMIAIRIVGGMPFVQRQHKVMASSKVKGAFCLLIFVGDDGCAAPRASGPDFRVKTCCSMNRGDVPSQRVELLRNLR